MFQPQQLKINDLNFKDMTSNITTKIGVVKVTHPEKQFLHCVYEFKTNDGFSIIGQTDDGLIARTKKRLTKESEMSTIKKHLTKNKEASVRAVYEVEDSFYKDVCEQFLIYQKLKGYVEEYFKQQNINIKVDLDNISYYRDYPGCKEFVDERCGNKKLDRKESLRYYLAHKDEEGFDDIEKFKVEE